LAIEQPGAPGTAWRHDDQRDDTTTSVAIRLQAWRRDDQLGDTTTSAQDRRDSGDGVMSAQYSY